MSLYWQSDSVRSYISVLLVKIATHTLNVTPNHWLVSLGCVMVGQETCLWFPCQDSSTFMMNQQYFFTGILAMCNPTQLHLWSKQPQNYSILRQVRVWLCRMWQRWTRNMSLFPLPRLVCLSDETTLSVYWCSYHTQSCIAAVLLETSTKLLNCATKWGVVWWNVATFDNKSVSGSPPRTHVPL